MNDWIFQMFGEGIPEADVTGLSFDLPGGAIGIGWIVLLALIGVSVTFFAYRWLPSELSRWRKGTLIGLRLLFFVLLVLILLQPVVRFDLVHKQRTTLVMMADVSESMSLAEPRIETNDLKRVAIARGVIASEDGLKGDLLIRQLPDYRQVARIDVLKAALQNTNLNLLPQLEKRFDLAPFTFAQNLSPAESEEVNATSKDGKDTWVDRLAAGGIATAIGGSLAEVFDTQREGTVQGNNEKERLGSRLAGVLLMTDGVNNVGTDPIELMERFAGEGDKVPLYIYGVGITSPRDLAVLTLSASETVFKGDEVLVRVLIQAEGLEGEKAEVQLIERDQDDLRAGNLGRKVASKNIDINPPDQQPQEIALRYTPTTDGNFDLKVRLVAEADKNEVGPVQNTFDEVDIENNIKHHNLSVIDPEKRPISVLIVEQAPRWEFRYLMAMLDQDRNKQVKLRVVLYEGDKSIVRSDTLNPRSPYLKEFPDAESLREFDVVILGDVSPESLDKDDGQESLLKFVADYGGRVVMLAGKRYFPSQYAGTELEQMLPVVLGKDRVVSGQENYGDSEIRIVRTERGRDDPLLRLAEDDGENNKIWGDNDPKLANNPDRLPPVFWVADVEQTKPQALELLVVDDDKKGKRFEQRPVLALHGYGAGEVMYVGTDNLWRWRKVGGDKYHVTFWNQIIERMALPRLVEFSRDFRLAVKRTHRVGARVRVTADMFDDDLGGGGGRSLKVRYAKIGGKEAAGGQEKELELQLSDEDNRTYRGEFRAPASGQYQLFLADYPNDPRYFSVTDSNLEKQVTAMNISMLQELAAKTGGKFFREEDLYQLDAAIPDRPRKVNTRIERELWSSWPFFLLLLLVITCEWAIRKLSYLK